MKTLLVTDGSSQAEAALSFGAQIAQRATVSPVILAVLNPAQQTQHYSDQLHSQAENILARARELVGIPGIPTVIRSGNLFDEVMDEAQQGGYDLVIIGDKQPRSFVNRIKWGSLAVRVADSAPRSVMVVRGHAGLIHRILLCDSGAGKSPLLSRLVVQLASLLEGEEEVTVLHVMSQISAGPGVRGAQLRAGALELIEEGAPEGEMLEQDIHLLEKPGILPVPKVRHGLVVDEILAEAHNGNYDLVVVGAHPEGGSQRFLLENIAHQVIKNVDRPILVVRP